MTICETRAAVKEIVRGLECVAVAAKAVSEAMKGFGKKKEDGDD
jgi:hypothetical protein